MTGTYSMKLLLVTLCAIVFLFFFIRFIEKRSLYFPFKNIEATPQDIGLDYEEIFVSAEDGVQISGWYIPSQTARATVLFSHGNAGNISHRLEKIKILHDLEVNILIFDYRGYGMSKGSPSEEGLYLDAEAVYSYLVSEKKIMPQKIIGYGESLGGAVTVNLAHKHELGGIILEGSFTSVRDMAKRYLPFIPVIVYKPSFDSSEKIKGIKAPKLHFHSLNDEVVPYDLGKKLFEAAPEPKELVQLQGGHNDSFIASQDIYTSKMKSFIDLL
jgi:fermentation-respiration switch protein FrsA (DUF1100 family)